MDYKLLQKSQLWNPILLRNWELYRIEKYVKILLNLKILTKSEKKNNFLEEFFIYIWCCMTKIIPVPFVRYPDIYVKNKIS